MTTRNVVILQMNLFGSGCEVEDNAVGATLMDLCTPTSVLCNPVQSCKRLNRSCSCLFQADIVRRTKPDLVIQTQQKQKESQTKGNDPDARITD